MDKVPDYTKNGPCPCGSSSDAFRMYPDGHGYCFSGFCKAPFFNEERLRKVGMPEARNSEDKMEYRNDEKLTDQYVDHRSISKAIFEKYKVVARVSGEDIKEFRFPYTEKGGKARRAAEKAFYLYGDRGPGVFGKLTFPKGSFKTCIITEGEFDALAANQMTGMAAFSVQSSASAKRDLDADHDLINSADKIYLAFDNDKAGQDALRVCSKSFDFNKLFKVELPLHKDANDYAANGHSKEFREAVQNATKFVPDGVISSYQEIRDALSAVQEKPIVEYPFKSMEDTLEGLRFSTSVLFSGLEGIGKTEILRKIEHHVLKNTDYNVGIIHLEEAKDATINFLLPYEALQPVRRKDVTIPLEDKMKYWEAITKRDNRTFIYSHFGSDNPDDFIDIVRFPVSVCGCKFVFFDHVNILVSRMSVTTDERRMLDYICSSMEKLVEELEFCFVFVCHENDGGGTRGSHNISQTAHVRIRLSRDIENPNEVERAKLNMVVAKNRPSSNTGPIGYAYFDSSTGTLVDGIPLNEEYLPKIDGA